jgi:hypothetical protein
MNRWDRIWHVLVMIGLGFRSTHAKWRMLCERNRTFHRLRMKWMKCTTSSEDRDRARVAFTRERKKLERLALALGMSEYAAELPLPMRYRHHGIPPIPHWIGK